jgi:hypothetical protein
MVPLADVSVYGPGQKAIVAWNGEEEVLILSTDVYADKVSTVLEVLPLPSMPDLINATDFSPFHAIEELLSQNKDTFVGGLARKGQDLVPGIDIVFHDKIGAHDITVIQVDSSADFKKWANDFLVQAGVSGEVSSKELAGLVQSYIRQGFPYFVLDLVELSTEPRTIEPLVYRFESPGLYFPLRVSALSSGDVDVSIFAVCNGPVTEEDLQPPLSVARFRGPLRRPVRFRITEEDLEDIHPLVRKLFDDGAWLTALTFSGSVKDLGADLLVDGVRTPLGDVLVGSHIFWLAAGTMLGIIFGLLLAQISVGVLRIRFRRLVAAADFAGILLLIILSSVIAYNWAPYAFWALVPLAVVSLYFTVRTGSRRILIVYLAIPFMLLVLIVTLILGQVLEAVIALVFLSGFLSAAAFPPVEGRGLSRALQRSSVWLRSSRRRGRL